MALLLPTMQKHGHAAMGPKNSAWGGDGLTISPIRLDPWCDAIGQLHELREQDGCLVAKIGPVAIALPSEMIEKLKGLVGRKISILRADSSDYRLRVRDEMGHA